MLFEIPLSLVKEWANNAPLIAGLLAPASTLYDIPALSQRWYALNGNELPDPHASLILSGFSLAASITANALLLLRFSVRWSKGWRWATRLSTGGWVLKTGIGMANLIVFGACTRNGPGYEYAQGFWCAVLSVIISGIISFLLLCHYFVNFNRNPDPNTRFNGRAILTSEMILFALLALNGLTFSRIEHWTYLEGIYFSVVSLLSIGFGDFSPTHTSTKILLFPFVVTGIALLANQISIIIDTTATRSEARKLKWRQRYAARIAQHEERKGEMIKDQSDIDVLHAEIKKLKDQAQSEEDITELAELFYSACALVSFWLIGAVIYHYTEGWSYGNSLYFNYVFLFTIGYGDYSPSSAAGQVVFVIWALLAVPIMSNFVVQTIQTLIGHATRVLAMATTQKQREMEQIEEEFYQPHSSYLQEAIKRLQSSDDDDDDDGQVQSDEVKAVDDVVDDMVRANDSPQMVQVEKPLLLDLLSTVTFLEAQARRIMVESLEKQSHARLLLQADGNIQLYTMEQLGARKHIRWLEEYEESMQEPNDLKRVKEYRRTYARFLVMGAKLMDLDGDRLYAFQRRRRDPENDLDIITSSNSNKEEGESGKAEISSDTNSSHTLSRSKR